MSGEVLMEGAGLTKRFGGVRALDDVDIEIRSGELLALLGDNGAGKSTLVGVLCGALRPDAGELYVRGRPVTFRGPADARALGIETVYQNLALVPTMDVASNLYLGREPVRRGWLRPLALVRRRAMASEATARLAELGISVPAVSGVPVERLSGGQRQAIAIARALAWTQGVVLMDEPTAALGVKQAESVLELARRVVDNGGGLVLITHTLGQALNTADRLLVLRHGRKIADLKRDEVASEAELARLIVGTATRS